MKASPPRHLRALLPADIRCGEGWVVDHVRHGAGLSSTTHGHAVLANGMWVFQHFYQPGPYHALAYGADSPLAAPNSTYLVFSGVQGSDDNGPSMRTLQAWMENLHPGVDVAALQAATIDIWSPDGEGAIYLRFDDLQVECAFALASSMTAKAHMDLARPLQRAAVPA